MILYKKEPFPLQMKNIMLLDDAKSGGVVYVSKTTYDQALMLHSRFDGNVQRVIDTLKSKKTEAYIAIPGLPNTINAMGKTMPEPLNILAPFLMLCTQNQGIEWNENDREFAYGILHQYSQLIDFNAMTLVPAEVRANVTIPTALLKQYQVSWDDICSTLEDKVVALPKQAVVQQVVQAPQTPEVKPIVAVQPAQPAPTTAQSTPAPAQPVKEEEPELSPLEKKLLAIRQQAEKRNEEINKKAAEAPKPKPVTPAVKPTTTDEQKAEAKAANAVLDEYDV